MHWGEVAGALTAIALAYWWGKQHGFADGKSKSDIICDACQKRIAGYFERNYERKDVVEVEK